jgi:alkylhydroperoxidase family enzyme
MPFFKSLPEDAGPGNVFSQYPEIFGLWAEMGQALINGPSPLTSGEREMIQAYVAGLMDVRYAHVAHVAAAEAQGIEVGLVAKLLENFDTAPLDDKLRPIFAYVRKHVLTPNNLTQEDADAVFAAGWDEKALHDTIVVTARMTFMARIVTGYGFTPMSPEKARANAEKRAKLGYVNLYPSLADGKSD